jgi:HIRAN domain
MARVSQSFSPPIPTGCQIYAPRLFVQGLHVETHRKPAEQFARGRAQEVVLVAEPANPHDKNAVRVVGNYKGMLLSSRADLGYVPREIAEALVHTGLITVATARLKYVSVAESGRVDIEFEIIGPREHKKSFDAFFAKKLHDGPVSDEQKEFAWFFGLKLPKGATFGQAQTDIDARTTSLSQESPESLKDWEAYWSICEELDDADNRRDVYSVKTISRKILRSAIDELRKNGKTLGQLADDPQLVVDRILADHPQLERAE